MQVTTSTHALHVVLCGLVPPLNRHARPLFPTARFSTSTPLCRTLVRRTRCVSHACSPTTLCVARLFADHVVCRTLVRRPRCVSHACSPTTLCVARSVPPYYSQCYRRRSLPRNQLFVDIGLFDPHFVSTITHNYTCGSTKVMLIQL